MRIWVYQSICTKYGFTAYISKTVTVPQHLFVKRPDRSNRFETLFCNSFKEIDVMEPDELEERLLQVMLESSFDN